MTADAPAAIAFAISPEKRIPPSAISGTPRSLSAAATLATALICGTPIPATIRVVQIEPGPIPTFTPSAPASANAMAASAVAMLPPTTCTCGNVSFTQRTRSITPFEWPCAVSTTIMSTPASTKARTRDSVSAPVPTAAPTIRRPRLSLAAFGYFWAFFISFTVTMPARANLSSTIRIFSIRCLRSNSLITDSSSSSCTVTRRSFGVMML